MAESPDKAAVDETGDESTQPMPAPTEPLPQPAEPPDAAAPAPQVDTPRLRDVGSTLARWLQGRLVAIRTALAGHRSLALAVALAGMAALVTAGIWLIDAQKVPSDEQIMADARARLAAPTHTTSPYEADGPLVLQDVRITGKHASGTRRDGCEVDVEATFASATLETSADAQLSYVRANDGWTLSAATVGTCSHRALAGVSQKQVVAHLDELMGAADHEDGESLASLYRNAQVDVVSESFDEAAQTDQLSLHCVSSGTFVSYECDLTASFRFASASGAWELARADVSKGARDLGFGPLLGSWQGTFVRQKASAGKCLAARETPLALTITRAEMTDDGSARIEGTLSGVAHLHADLDEDAGATDGDLQLASVPFAGTLSTGEVDLDVISLLAGNNPKQDVAGIEFVCSVQDLAEGAVTLTLTFGQADDPTAATATLASTHRYQDYFLMLVPYEREARFVDRYTLEKVD